MFRYKTRISRRKLSPIAPVQLLCRCDTRACATQQYTRNVRIADQTLHCAQAFPREAANMSSSYALQTIVRGYHAYKDIWNAATGQILSCQCERGKVHDPYAVDVVERGVTV